MKARVPTKLEMQNRLKDEMKGIRQGAPDMNPPGMATKAAEPLPDIRELGVTLSARRRIEELVELDVSLAGSIKLAEDQRECGREELKRLLTEHIDAPSFLVSDVKVTRFTQNREKLSKDKLRVALLNRGVKPTIVADSIAEATDALEVSMLKVSRLKDE